MVTDKKPADFYIQRSLRYIIMIGFHGIARNRKSKYKFKFKEKIKIDVENAVIIAEDFHLKQLQRP